MKLCIDCYYYTHKQECTHPISNWHTDPVDGFKTYYTCAAMRDCVQCGEPAKLFKEVPSMMALIKEWFK